MIDLNNILINLKIKADYLKDEYEIMIDQIFSQLNSPPIDKKGLITKVYEDSFLFFSNFLRNSIIINSTKVELAGQEELYQLIIENANDLIAVQNDKFEYVYINESVFKKILGYSKNDLIGKTNLHLIHPDDLKKTILTTSKILKKGEGIHRVRFKTKKGDYKWLEVTGRNFNNKFGENNILTILRDVTEHINSEVKLKASENQFKSITEQLLMGVCILQDNQIKFVNKRFADMFGYTIEEVMK